jgi:hypothetical protein
VTPVEDTQRDHRLAAEQRRRIGFVGDAAGIGRNLVGAEAQDRVAAAALKSDAFDLAGALADRAGIAAVEEEEPDAVRRRGEKGGGPAAVDRNQS